MANFLPRQHLPMFDIWGKYFKIIPKDCKKRVWYCDVTAVLHYCKSVAGSLNYWWWFSLWSFCLERQANFNGYENLTAAKCKVFTFESDQRKFGWSDSKVKAALWMFGPNIQRAARNLCVGGYKIFCKPPKGANMQCVLWPKAHTCILAEYFPNVGQLQLGHCSST